MLKIMTLGAMALALAATPTSAATLVVDSNGVLTGAKGVTVGTKTYDVAFVSGSCAGAYGKCETPSFDFTTKAQAREAAAALLSQVFTDGTAGKFDSNPAKTAGCNNEYYSCIAVIAYGLNSPQSEQFYAAFAVNESDPEYDRVMDGLATVGEDFSRENRKIIARFTSVGANDPIVAAVPEPATWAMMLVGFGAIGAAMRRRRQGVAVRCA